MVKYSFLDRLLHRTALQFAPIAEMSFDFDQMTMRSDPKAITAERHVFVSGLARAGTTILMRRFYATGAYCSLTYRNMPFVLAPNIWSRFTRNSKRKDAPTERAHGDRILVDIDSPESLDEVFWRVFDGAGYIRQEHLTAHEPDQETIQKYVAYVAAILRANRKGQTRYLSKNNNNILRLQTIRRAFPNSVILIPFRDPLSHARSLMQQHKLFVAQQTTDPFIRSYMTWLSHHEFGLDHRPFQFDAAAGQNLSARHLDQFEYWLDLWCHTYAWLEKSAPADATFVCYEDLCRDADVWRRLAKICGSPNCDGDHEPFVISKTGTDANAPSVLEDAASAIYMRLVNRARAALAGAPPGQKSPV